MEKQNGRDSIADIEKYYEFNNEENRAKIQALEFAVTGALLDYYLPEKSKVLEIGAGTGHYTLKLAQNSHQVTAVELVASLTAINQNRIQNLGLEKNVSFETGDAREVIKSSESESFDVILIMGPLYHLTESNDRIELMSHATRVLRKNGLLISTHLSRIGLLGYMLTRFPEWAQTSNEEVGQIIKDGFLKEHPRNGEFRGYFSTADEICELHFAQNLDVIGLHCQDPCIGSVDEIYNRLPPNLQQTWTDVLVRISQDPMALGSGRSLFCVSKKK